MTGGPRPGAAARGARDVGLIVLALGVVCLPALAVDLAHGPTPALPGLAGLSALGIGAGTLTLRATPQGEPRGGGEALVAVALGWLLCAALAAVPFWAAAHLDPAPSATLEAFRRPAAAFFEAMSGVTGTGLSVASDPSELVPSLQLWRSLTQWAGGIGWMLLALMLLAPLRGLPGGGEEGAAYARHLPQLNAERTTDALAQRAAQPVVVIWGIYGAYTAAAVAAFRLAGMPSWEALNHGLTGISTGGFAVTPDSFNSYGPAVLWTGIAIMTVGAVSFAAHAAILTLARPSPSEARQLRWLMGCLAGGFAAALLAARHAGATPLEAGFNWVSAIATCGFVASPPGAWPAAGVLMLSLAMFVGASSGSTGGGLKMRRLYTIAEGLGHRVASASESGERDEHTGEEDRTQYKRLHDAAARLCFLAGAVAAGLLGLLVFAPGFDAPLEDVLLDATAALSTAGLTTGFTGPDLPSGALLVLAALMWLGRLEVLAVLVTVLAAARLAGRGATGPLRLLGLARPRSRAARRTN